LLSEGPHKQQQLFQQSLCGLTFATKKKSPETKTFPIPERKEKSTRRENPKTNNSKQAANTKRQNNLPKKNLWVFVSSHKQKHFVLMGFAQ
jgi:predicted adenine nucleotide alpha hydrolase (AANH) superfamily ATPase